MIDSVNYLLDFLFHSFQNDDDDDENNRTFIDLTRNVLENFPECAIHARGHNSIPLEFTIFSS